MKKYITVIAAILLSVLPAHADEVAVKDITLQQGGKATVEIELNNPSKTYTAFQFEMELPEGITVATDEDGEFAIENGSRLGSDHSIGCSSIKDGVRLVCVSASTAAISGTNGTLLTLQLQADANLTAGMSYEVGLKKIAFTTTAGREVELDDVSFSVTVENSAKRGDVNGDGSITIADVTALVNIILGKSQDANTSIADVNGDGSITIADVTSLVNMILGK